MDEEPNEVDEKNKGDGEVHEKGAEKGSPTLSRMEEGEIRDAK
jgi:hypothetical protein